MIDPRIIRAAETFPEYQHVVDGLRLRRFATHLSWVVDYTYPSKTRHQITIGCFPAMSREDAIRIAEKTKRSIRKTEDAKSLSGDQVGVDKMLAYCVLILFAGLVFLTCVGLFWSK